MIHENCFKDIACDELANKTNGLSLQSSCPLRNPCDCGITPILDGESHLVDNITTDVVSEKLT